MGRLVILEILEILEILAKLENTQGGAPLGAPPFFVITNHHHPSPFSYSPKFMQWFA
jgi:hypothetical protein